MIGEYQKEQLEALQMVRAYLADLSAEQLSSINSTSLNYIEYRHGLDVFLKRNFNKLCTRQCYENHRSACCTREGIITFFADVVINVLVSDQIALDRLAEVLEKPTLGYGCVYLSRRGCLWNIKPIVCELFLCDRAEREVLLQNPRLESTWYDLKQRAKTFKWPDRPVLFDALEDLFIRAGYQSPLMYLHNSPGLLRVKKQAGI